MEILIPPYALHSAANLVWNDWLAVVRKEGAK